MKLRGIRVAGIDIGNYNGSWDKLFQKSIEVIKKFKEPFLLLTDGDIGGGVSKAT